jgi:hypothetical protein
LLVRLLGKALEDIRSGAVLSSSTGEVVVLLDEGPL